MTNWIMFKPRGENVTYLFHTTFPMLVYTGPEVVKEDWYWTGNPPESIPVKELQVLEEARDNVRKRTFEIKRNGLTEQFDITNRGSF